MEILVVGDFHGKFPSKLKKEVKNVDFVLSTGDFGGGDKLLKIIFKYFKQKWWKKVGVEKGKNYVLEDYNSGKKILNELNSLNKPVYSIVGNWDFTSNSVERWAGLKLGSYRTIARKFNNLKIWNRGIKRVKGLKILAFGGMVTAGAYVRTNFFDEKIKKKYIKKNREEIKKIMSYGCEDIDILFTHYTPYGYFDVVKSIKENPMNGKHVGFEGFTNYIKKYKPQICISGHMHEYQGIKKLGKTRIVATGSAKEGKAVILSVDNKTKKIGKIRFIN